MKGGTFGSFDAKPLAQRIEKTVFVKGTLSLKYVDVLRVIDAVKGSGAHPVGLQIDDLPE